MLFSRLDNRPKAQERVHLCDMDARCVSKKEEKDKTLYIQMGNNQEGYGCRPFGNLPGLFDAHVWPINVKQKSIQG